MVYDYRTGKAKKELDLPLSLSSIVESDPVSASLARGANVLPSSSNTTLVPTGLCILIFNFFFFKTLVADLQIPEETNPSNL